MPPSTAAESSAKGPVSDWVPPTYSIFAAWAPTGNNNVVPTKIIALTVNIHLILAIFFLLSDLMYDFVSTPNPPCSNFRPLNLLSLFLILKTIHGVFSEIVSYPLSL
jgi:hypothetical protein